MSNLFLNSSIIDLGWSYEVSAYNIVQDVMVALIFIALPILLYFFSKRIFTVILSSILSVCAIVFTFFDFTYLFISIVLIYMVSLVINIFVNLGILRPYLIKRFSGKNSNHKRKLRKDKEVAKIYDKVTLYSQLTEAVKFFSNTKTGALITFERGDDLKPLMKNGVTLNAPFNRELLETIFYKGTRLHDGAVIIKNNKIVAASVYYNLTTRPLNGNYGTRHRAAIGISENSDSITVVVSEETGRISIAKDGNIDPVSPDKFERLFTEYMEENEE